MNLYTIESILITPDSWFFDKTIAPNLSNKFEFFSPNEHGKTRHIIRYQCEAAGLNDAWKAFYEDATEFIEVVAFHTSSYLSFYDWTHLIINHTKESALISTFERTLGTPLGLYGEDSVSDVHKLISIARDDEELKNFLHCFRMAILVDAPETQDAYEKYLILASEALAGEVEVTGEDRTKVNSKKLKEIIGKELHHHFFSSVDKRTGKTVRNANMHIGKSNNMKPSQTIRLVNMLRNYVAEKYELKALTIIEEDYSPTRGYYRDDGERMLFVGNVHELSLLNIEKVSLFMRGIPDDIHIPENEAWAETFKNL